MTSPEVTTFALEATVDALPPTVKDITAILAAALPAGSTCLQWAIVKTDPVGKRLWIEGSQISPQG